ncbi:MAG TPA: hypothetical protein VND66_04125 [Acidobacteriaceae bacterium]|nr:hypothetical protein [Terriglobia bacterium]HVC89791.1 hypothetical protein [Acidobacteriaceae bacterium]
MKTKQALIVCLAFVALLFATKPSNASTSKEAQEAFSKALLGKDVKALIDMPAYKEGIDIYYTPPSDKRTDDRGIDLKGLTKWLKAKGVGVEKGEDVTITNVKVDSKMIEIHLGGGGEGRRGSNHANKVNAGFKRAGGSRINFRYQRDLTDADLQPSQFFKFMGRVVDVSGIETQLDVKKMPADDQAAIDNHTVINGMTYEMVLLSFGDPEQKKVEDSTDSTFKETWFYLREGHRWILHFENGKVAQIQTF